MGSIGYWYPLNIYIFLQLFTTFNVSLMAHLTIMIHVAYHRHVNLSLSLFKMPQKMTRVSKVLNV